MPAIAKLSDEDVKFLETVFPGALITKPEELNVYVSDASLQSGSPLCCVLPERVEQVQALFAWADEKRIPIYVRGRGTNLVGDCVAFKPGIVVSTARMDHILEINKGDFVAVGEPGDNTAQFQAACEAQGLS